MTISNSDYTTCKFFNLLHLLFIRMALVPVFMGCSGHTEDLSVSKKLVDGNKNLTLKIDDQTPNFSFGLNYFHDTKPWLFSLNQQQNELQMYDINESKLFKKLTFEIEGDKGVGQIQGFHVHNLDSIFLFPNFTNTIYLTDTSQAKIQKITYEVPSMHTPAFVLMHSFASPPVIRGDQMIVKTRPEGNYRKMKNEELSTRHLTYSIHLNNGETVPIKHYHPDGYLSGGAKNFEFSFAASEDKMVYSFFADHHLYYSNSTESEIKAVSAPSNYLKEDFPNHPLSDVTFENLKYTFASAHYGGIIYDQYRDVFYRFCFPEAEAKNQEEIMQLRGFPNTFSIMILDGELNVLGETLFDGGQYVPNNCFVAEEGLYISINHPDNPDNKEDFLSFALLTLEENN
ncbi:MAG: DUF4221 family protein [Anditalea sp.]